MDAMIPREDFAIAQEEFTLDLFGDFPISNLASDSPILKLLRKPDFQRETNHWSPEQLATFIASFLDNEVIPSLILWKSPRYIFVIDGGHRLSALRAWMLDDYGDRGTSLSFYNGEISDDQKRIAARTRKLIEAKVGRYTSLRALIDSGVSDDPVALKRANRLVTRALNLQWIQGNADVAETSFFKINSQGTPLDDTEEMLIRNRRKPIAIAARAILRSGSGHKYWSSFADNNRERIEEVSHRFYELLFEPEPSLPLKTLDVPYGGSVSPVDALSLLIDFLTLASNRQQKVKNIDEYDNDSEGTETVALLRRSLEVLERVTGNSPGSLGLHPAVYFYNERGKYNRFLFLGVCAVIAEKLANNDKEFFRKFTKARVNLEKFLIDNKSLIGIVLQNLSRGQRVPRMKELLEFVVAEGATGAIPTVEQAVAKLGLKGRILDVTSNQPSTQFSDATKTMLFVNSALATALKCPICSGYLHPVKSVSYDHITRIRDGGSGDVANGQMVHPYCNSGFKA